MELKTIETTFKRIIITDLAVLLAVLLVPALSHATPIPLYYLDPMRLFIFAGFVFGRNHNNAYALAVSIPIFSMLVTGHPVFFKSLLISGELFSNIYIFNYLYNNKRINTITSIVLSILLSKCIYYSCKAILLHFSFLDGSLITTQIWIQFISGVFITLAAYFLLKQNKIERIVQ